MERLDNNLTIILLVVVISFVYLYVTYGKKESFDRNKASLNIPGPAVIVKQDPPMPVPRQVSPSGPNPPNARIPEIEARKLDVLNVVPNDPYDEINGSQNMKDNLRYPERSFGPGIINDSKKVYVMNGVASHVINESNNNIQQFSQEMIENGGIFNESYGANDTNLNPNYSAF